MHSRGAAGYGKGRRNEEKGIDTISEIEKIEENFLDIEKRNDLVPIQECMLEIQSFAVWFLEKNQLEEETEKWKEKKRELLCILQDIITAIEQQDYVLMHDAITYGVMKYLHWFIKEPVEEIV